MELDIIKTKYRTLLTNRLAKALAPAYAKGHIVAALEAKMHDDGTRLIKPTQGMYLDRLRPLIEPILDYYDRFTDALIARIEEELKTDNPDVVAARLLADTDRLMNEDYVSW